MSLASSRSSRYTHRYATHLKVVDSSQGLPFEKIAHKVDTVDAQPSGPNGGIIVMVTGALLVTTYASLNEDTVLKIVRSTRSRDQ